MPADTRSKLSFLGTHRNILSVCRNQDIRRAYGQAPQDTGQVLYGRCPGQLQLPYRHDNAPASDGWHCCRIWHQSRACKKRNPLDISTNISAASVKKTTNFIFFLLYFRRIFVPLRPRNFTYRSFDCFGRDFLE